MRGAWSTRWGPRRVNIFRNREEAGEALADALADRGYADPVCLALPRGGVPIACIVAHRLGAPVDLVMVRKLGVPRQPELAAGAVVNGDAPQMVVNHDIAAAAGLRQADLDRLAEAQLREIARRRDAYLGNRPSVPVEGRMAIVVDDGIATGATMRAALLGVRARRPSRLVLAVPVAAPDTLAALKGEVDEAVALLQPRHLHAIGAYYEDFSQVEDDAVRRMLVESPL